MRKKSLRWPNDTAFDTRRRVPYLYRSKRARRPGVPDCCQQIRTALHITNPVVAQTCWNSSRHARLAALLQTITIHPLNDGRPVGQLLAQTRTSDVIDAHLVITAVRLGDDILTGDPDDLTTLSAVLGPASPTIHP